MRLLRPCTLASAALLAGTRLGAAEGALPALEFVVDGAHLLLATADVVRAVPATEDGQSRLGILLGKQAGNRFEVLTERTVGQEMHVLICREVLAVVTVSAAIEGGQISIVMDDQSTAERFASMLSGPDGCNDDAVE